ncbi:MAG TPA: hypothetical protein VMT46_15370 [Anaerolineaceae bacterium]|nr:hypothetical protein [Anaerolineaceae bacterium]
MKQFWLLAVLALALASCAEGAAGQVALSASPSAPPESSSTPPPGSPTPTINWFPATATPTVRPTEVLPPTPDPHPNLGEILLADDFSQPGAWQTQQSSLGTVAYGQNELTLAIPNVKTGLYSQRKQTSLSDFYLEITAMPILCRGSDAYGLLIRATSARDYYRWILTCDGQMRLERLKGQTIAVIQDWTLRAARPDATRLGVWASGPNMRFLIDNILQFEVHDPVFPGGGLGVFARSNGENSLTVSFSDLVVRAIGKGEKVGPAGTEKALATATAKP